MPAAERRWSGPFRTCPACAKRNFVGRSACTACGAPLRGVVPPARPSPGFFTGRRGSDRLEGRGLALAGGAIALVALVAGVLAYRSLHGIEWGPIPGLARGLSSPPPPSPIEAMGAPPTPAFPRPEDRVTYEKGRRLLAAGDARGALGPLTEAALRLPQDAGVVHDYGLALVGAGDVERGLFQLEHASRLAPGIGTYRLDLVRALLAAGRRGPAARELREVLVRDPTNVEAAELLAGLADEASPSDGAASPGATSGSMDLGGAAGGATPRPTEGGAAFTNEDLGRRRTAPPVAASVSPAVASPATPPSAPPTTPPPAPPSPGSGLPGAAPHRDWRSP